MTARYRVRFTFDTGSGICLWSANDAARHRFGYPVDLDQLSLPESVRRRGAFVMAWFDTFLDWESPSEASRWLAREEASFHAAAQELLALFREHLGTDFEIVDESRSANPVEAISATESR